MQQDAREHQLQAALGEGGQAEVLGHDLTLLGDLDPAVHRTRGQGGERARHRRAAAPAHGAAPAVEQRPRHAGAGTRARHFLLHAVQRPRRREQPSVLGGVRVTQHHLLVPPPGGEVALPHGVVQQRADHERRVLQVLQGLEQRHDVDARERGLARQVHQPRLPREEQHAQQIVGGARARNDIGRRRRPADFVLDVAHGVKHPQRLVGRPRERDVRRVQWPPAGQLAPDGRAIELPQTDRRAEVAQRPGVGPGVFPYVETVAVEAVRAYLGQERLHQGTPGVCRADRMQRLGDEHEIALQLARGSVPGGIGLHPGPHEADLQAERLVGVAAAILLPHGRQLHAIVLE